MKLYSVALCCVVVLLSSCRTGMAPSGSASGDVIDFRIDDSVMQYYVRPIELDGIDHDEDMDLDITFRDGDRATDSVTMNFTIDGSRILKRIDTMTIVAGGQSVQSTSIRLLFNEADGEDVRSRFSAIFRRRDFYNLIQTPEWIVSIVSNNEVRRYEASGSAVSRLQRVDQSLIRILRAP